MKGEKRSTGDSIASGHEETSGHESADIFRALHQFLTQSSVSTDILRLRLGDLGQAILDAIKGSPIVPVSQHIVDTIGVSNRIVSFVLSDSMHFGTGVLVGPAHVLTAAHLFFDYRGVLLDREQPKGVTVEAHTTLVGRIVVEGETRRVKLDPDDDQWIVGPRLQPVAHEDDAGLDFAIVKLDQRIGDDDVGNGQTRRWFDIPTVRTAQILSPDLVIRVYQFLDRGALLTSGGRILDVTNDRMRVYHTASTADSASGAAILDDQFNLVGLHLSGPASSDFPIANRALPIRRVAEVIDQNTQGSPTIRSTLK